MKKFFLLMLGILVSGAAANAQSTIFNNPENKAYFGVRVGADVNCPGSVYDDFISLDIFKNGAGLEFGGIYNVPVVANFYVEPGLKLYYDTYSYNTDAIVGDFPIDGISVRKFGMRIPVQAGYHFDFTKDIKVSVFTGPELDVAFSGKACMKSEGESSSESIYGDDSEMRRVNLLWGFGAGISYGRFSFDVKGGIGMLNLYKDPSLKFHENRVTFSLGYNF